MNRPVNAIAGRLGLRKPQRDSLEFLERIAEIVPPSKAADIAAALDIIRGKNSKFDSLLDGREERPDHPRPSA